MRIGINLLFLLPGRVGGTETYVRNLLFALGKLDDANEYIVFTNRENHASLQHLPANFLRQLIDIPATSRLVRIGAEQLLLPFLVSQLNLDVLHSPGYVAPILARCASVVSILDMLFYHYPEMVPRLKRWYWGWAIPASARRCEHILTISSYSKDDLTRCLKIPASKITVTWLACDARLRQVLSRMSSKQRSAIRRKYHLKGRYILSVAGATPHKNLMGLIHAFAELHQRESEVRDVTLALVGLPLTETGKIQHLIDSLNLHTQVQWLGYIPLQDLPGLYAEANVFAFPSLFEGFGLPVLEAMACGTPVVCSNVASLPELVEDAGILVNPRNHIEMADAIFRVLTNRELREDLVYKGYQQVQKFSWEKTARQTLEVYESIARMDGVRDKTIH